MEKYVGLANGFLKWKVPQNLDAFNKGLYNILGNILPQTLNMFSSQ